MLTINPAGLPGVQGDLLMVMDSAAQIQGADALGRLLDRYTPDRNLFVRDAAPASGGAFLQGELEKPDFNLNEPLVNVTWPRDVPYETGGGFVDFTSNFFVDYATHGANQYGLMGVDTNNLPTIQTNVSKDLFKVYRFGYIVKVPLISQQRLQMVGRSIENMLQTGLRLNYDLMLNDNAYLGLDPVGSKGLLNQGTSFEAASATAVYQTYAAADGSNNSRKWADKTPEQILAELNNFLTQIWANGQYSPDAMPNQIGLPPQVMADLTIRLISTAGSASIMTYLMANNIAKTMFNIDLQIVPMRQTIDVGDALVSGTTSSGRMVAYVNDKKRLHFDETVPLTRLITQPSAEQVAYLSTYVASVGVLKILYFQTIGYMDGIS
jgi:hypothetical protein